MSAELLNKLGYRRIILDYHFSDFPAGALVNADAAHIVKAVKEANATSLLMYTKDHWGNMYTGTKRFKHHKNVPFDLFGQVLEEAKRQGELEVFAYYSVCWDEHHARLYPEWLGRDKDGNVRRPQHVMAKWNTLCINSPYRDIVFSQLAELVRDYDFPALFLDIIMYNFGDFNTPCYCSYCKRLWEEEYGTEMPREFGFDDKIKYLKLRDSFYKKFLYDVRAVVVNEGKNVPLVHNFGVDFEFDDYMSKEAEPWGRDYYSGSMAGKIFRSYAGDKSTEIISARFNQAWDFTIKPETQLIWEGMTALAHNAAFLVIDQPNIDGTIEKKSTAAIKAVFDEIRKVEGIVDGSKPYSEIALMFSYKNQELIYEKLHYAQFEEEFYGAYKMLTELHFPFDVITDIKLSADKLHGIKVLIVPNILCISEENISIVKDFVSDGGILIFTYKSATRDRDGEQLRPENCSFGIVGRLMESPNRFKFCEAFGGMNMPYMRINNGCVYTYPVQGEEYSAVSKLVNPAMECSSDKWISHNVQPGDTDIHPGIISCGISKGKAIYFSYKFFTEYLEQGLSDYKRGFAGLLNQYYNPCIHVKANSNVEVNYLQKDGKTIIFLTNCTVSKPAGSYRKGLGTFHNNFDEVIPACNVRIASRIKFEKAESLKLGRLEVVKNEGGWEAVLPYLELYDVITLTSDASSK